MANEKVWVNGQRNANMYSAGYPNEIIRKIEFGVTGQDVFIKEAQKVDGNISLHQKLNFFPNSMNPPGFQFDNSVKKLYYSVVADGVTPQNKNDFRDKISSVVDNFLKESDPNKDPRILIFRAGGMNAHAATYAIRIDRRPGHSCEILVTNSLSGPFAEWDNLAIAGFNQALQLNHVPPAHNPVRITPDRYPGVWQDANSCSGISSQVLLFLSAMFSNNPEVTFVQLEASLVRYMEGFGGGAKEQKLREFHQALLDLPAGLPHKNAPQAERDAYQAQINAVLDRFPEFKLPALVNTPAQKNNQTISYANNFSDHHPQRALINNQHNLMIWNVTKKCGPLVPSGFNNGFGKNETDPEYTARVNKIGEKINGAIKNDPGLGIILLQEVQNDHHNSLANKAIVGVNWSSSSNTTNTNNKELLTLYDNQKYEKVAISDPEMVQLTNSVHPVHPILLRDRVSLELLLVVNIHAKYGPQHDAALKQKLVELERFALSKGAKLVVGGDFNRDIKNPENGKDFKQELQVANPNLSTDHGGKGSYAYDAAGPKSPDARDGFVVGPGLAITNVELDLTLNQKQALAPAPAPVSAPAAIAPAGPNTANKTSDANPKVSQAQDPKVSANPKDVISYLKDTYGNYDPNKGCSIKSGFGKPDLILQVNKNGGLSASVEKCDETALRKMLEAMLDKIVYFNEPGTVILGGSPEAIDIMKKICKEPKFSKLEPVTEPEKTEEVKETPAQKNNDSNSSSLTFPVGPGM